MKFDNPFVLGSGPPGTNARVIAKSFDAGWGGAVAKTVSLESSKVVNVVPRYGKLRSRTETLKFLKPFAPPKKSSPRAFE